MTGEIPREKLAELAKRLEEVLSHLTGIMDFLATEEEKIHETEGELQGVIETAQGVADALATLAVPTEKVATETQEVVPPELEEAIKKAAEERKQDRVILEVHEVLEKTARELFGPSAKDPTRRYWALYHRSKDGKTRKLGQIPIPTDPTKVSPRSLAARYVAKYGHLPRAGDKVELRRGEDGWLELVL